MSHCIVRLPIAILTRIECFLIGYDLTWNVYNNFRSSVFLLFTDSLILQDKTELLGSTICTCCQRFFETAVAASDCWTEWPTLDYRVWALSSRKTDKIHSTKWWHWFCQILETALFSNYWVMLIYTVMNVIVMLEKVNKNIRKLFYFILFTCESPLLKVHKPKGLSELTSLEVKKIFILCWE